MELWIAWGIAAYLLCILIVAFDREHNRNLVKLLLFIPALLLALPPTLYLIETQTTGENFLYEFGSYVTKKVDSNDGDASCSLPTIVCILLVPVGAVLMILYGILVFLLALLVPLATPIVVIVAVIAWILFFVISVYAWPTAFLVPVIAARNVFRGIGVTTHSLYFFFHEPKAVREIKNAYEAQRRTRKEKSKDADGERLATDDAGEKFRKFAEELLREQRRDE